MSLPLDAAAFALKESFAEEIFALARSMYPTPDLDPAAGSASSAFSRDNRLDGADAATVLAALLL